MAKDGALSDQNQSLRNFTAYEEIWNFILQALNRHDIPELKAPNDNSLFVSTAASLATPTNGHGMRVSSSDRWIPDGYLAQGDKCIMFTVIARCEAEAPSLAMEYPNGKAVSGS